MLYLGIDLHRKQLTVSVRNEKGDVILRRQVSTRWDKVREFLKWVQAEALREGGFVAVVETCGFEGWLIGLLKEYGCRDVVLIQPEKRSKKKTDRRDAHAMSELLWVNRQRLLAGQKVQGVRRVRLASVEEQEDRRIQDPEPGLRAGAVGALHFRHHREGSGKAWRGRVPSGTIPPSR